MLGYLGAERAAGIRDDDVGGREIDGQQHVDAGAHRLNPAQRARLSQRRRGEVVAKEDRRAGHRAGNGVRRQLPDDLKRTVRQRGADAVDQRPVRVVGENDAVVGQR